MRGGLNSSLAKRSCIVKLSCCGSETPAPSAIQKEFLAWLQSYRSKPAICRARTTAEDTGYLFTAQWDGNLFKQTKPRPEATRTKMGFKAVGSVPAPPVGAHGYGSLPVQQGGQDSVRQVLVVRPGERQTRYHHFVKCEAWGPAIQSAVEER